MYQNATERRPVSQSLATTLHIRNADMRREMEANTTVSHLLRFISRVDANDYNRSTLVEALEACMQEAESHDHDIRLHKFLADALEFVKST